MNGVFPKNKYHKYCWIIGNPKIGVGTWIGPWTIIDGSGGLEIGKNCDIGVGVKIYTHSTVNRCLLGTKFYGGHVNREDIEHKPVKIGNNTFIGAGSIIQPGVTIGSHCVVQPNSVVTHDVADKIMVGGNPAKPLATIIIPKKGKVHFNWVNK